MPDTRTMKRLMEDATRWVEQYRSTNIIPAHRRADRLYHGILDNEAEYEERGRSHLFIPKTRNHVRRWTTTIVNAFYTSDDVVTLSNPTDEAGQRFTNEVFNLRLEKYSDFFSFLSRAAHAYVKYGNVVGKVGWDYEERTVTERMEDPETGEEVRYEISAPVRNAPFLEVVPFENVQLDYRCQGIDPVQESPFFREWIPMYLSDVERRWKSGEWRRPRGVDWTAVRVPSDMALARDDRHGRMADPMETQFDSSAGAEPSSSYDQVWVVSNYFRIDGTDWHWMSLGDESVLTSPVRVADKFVHGRRPYALAAFDPEPFRVISDGLPEMLRHLQAETNAIRNQRRDNVSLVLAGGMLVSRDANANIESLVNRRPGWIGVADRIDDGHIRFVQPPDVTGSSYREEQVANEDIEEISGQSRNRLGVMSSDRQTATEAAITASASGEQEAFVIKNFVQAFIRPLFEMYLANLIAYEDDEAVLADASIATGLPPHTRLVPCEVVINAGMGSTNKELKAARVREALGLMIQAKFPVEAIAEVFKELFPLLGFKNVRRFLRGVATDSDGTRQVAASSVEPPEVPPPPPGRAPEATPPPAGQSPGIAPPLRDMAEEVPGIGGYARGLLQ